MPLLYLPVVALVLLMFPQNNLAGAVQLPSTGQDTCYNATGVIIDCTGTGQDGDKRAGAVLPERRFLDNDNGTVTDRLTGLVWLKDANCTETTLGAFGNPEMLELAKATGQSSANLPERVRMGEVAEKHGDKLRPATEPFCLVLGTMVNDQFLKMRTGNMLKKLTKQTRNLYHGVALS